MEWATEDAEGVEDAASGVVTGYTSELAPVGYAPLEEVQEVETSLFEGMTELLLMISDVEMVTTEEVSMVLLLTGTTELDGETSGVGDDAMLLEPG